MRFLLDTNILVYAANPSGKEYGRTRKYLDERFGEHGSIRDHDRRVQLPLAHGPRYTHLFPKFNAEGFRGL